MNCEACGARPATVRYAEVVDGVLSTWRLCEECAGERGVAESLTSFAGPLVNILMGLLEGEEGRGSEEGRTCARCGRTYRTFRRTGRLGCAACYSAFGEELRPLLRRIHGSNEHVGCVPREIAGRHSRMKELKKLRTKLERAVRAEEYERAAGLRDTIAALQGEIADEREQSGCPIRETGSRERQGVDAQDDDA